MDWSVEMLGPPMPTAVLAFREHACAQVAVNVSSKYSSRIGGDGRREEKSDECSQED